MFEGLKSHPDEEALHGFLDGEMEPQLRARLERHLEGCQACSERLEALETVFYSLQAVPEIPLERDLSTSVLEALEMQTRRTIALNALLLIEAIVTLVLAFLIWPSFSSLFMTLSASVRAWWDTGPLEMILQQINSGWLEAQASVQVLLSPPFLRQRGAIFPEGTLAEFWPAVFVAVLLWLLANGFFFRIWQERHPQANQR